MTDIDFAVPAPDGRLPNLVLWLSRKIGEGSGWMVDRVNVNGNGYKHNIDFATGREACDTFAAAFWQYITPYLPTGLDKVSLGAGDAVFETAEILLQRLSVTSRALKDGTQRVLITFRNALGDLCRLFQPGQFPSILLEAERNVATRTLIDLILPALRLAEEPIEAFERDDRKVSAFVEKLQENRRQIELYAGLITSIRDAANKGHRAPLRDAAEPRATIKEPLPEAT